MNQVAVFHDAWAARTRDASQLWSLHDSPRRTNDLGSDRAVPCGRRAGQRLPVGRRPGPAVAAGDEGAVDAPRRGGAAAVDGHFRHLLGSAAAAPLTA